MIPSWSMLTSWEDLPSLLAGVCSSRTPAASVKTSFPDIVLKVRPVANDIGSQGFQCYFVTQLKVFSIFSIICTPRIMLVINQIKSGKSWEEPCWGREDSLIRIA